MADTPDSSALQQIFQDLKQNEPGITLQMFLRLLYPIQSHRLMFLDLYRIYRLSNGSDTRYLDGVEFISAMTKVMHARHDTSLSKLLTELSYLEQTEMQLTSIQERMLQREVLDVFGQYEANLKSSFDMYSGKRDKINFEECVDYFTGNFICPELLTEPECQKLFDQVRASSRTTTKACSMDELLFPHFCELLALLALTVHEAKLTQEGGHDLRKATDLLRLGYCLKQIFQRMGFSSIDSAPASASAGTSTDKTPGNPAPGNPDRETSVLPDMLKLKLALSHEETTLVKKPFMKPLPRRSISTKQVHARPRTAPSVKPLKLKTLDGNMETIVIREILAIPSHFPLTVQRTMESALRYQNNNQHELGRVTLAHARYILNSTAPEDDVYFELVLGNAHESQRQDVTAMKHYMTAYKLMSDLPLDHVLRPSIYASLGGMCYYNNQAQAALQCYERALELRRNYFPHNVVDIGTCMNNIGCCWHSQDTSEDCHARFKCAYEIIKEECGASHPRARVILKNLTKSRTRQGPISTESLSLIQNVREDSRYLIPGGRFYVNAIVVDNTPASGSSKKKKTTAKGKKGTTGKKKKK